MDSKILYLNYSKPAKLYIRFIQYVKYINVVYTLNIQTQDVPVLMNSSITNTTVVSQTEALVPGDVLYWLDKPFSFAVNHFSLCTYKKSH